MTTSTVTHDGLCRDAAAAFLQTALVIDNEARLSDSDIPSLPRTADRIGKPTVRIARKEPAPLSKTPKEQKALPPEPPLAKGQVPDPHDLDAKALSDAFLVKRIMCGIYKPTPREDMVKKSTDAAIAADIVIVDWQLEGPKNGSKKAKEIIAAVLLGDLAHGGRLRLFVVYTGQPNLKALAEELLKHLHRSPEMAGITIDGDDPTVLVGPHSRVVFCNKALTVSAVQGERTASEGELPGELVTQFAKLARGVLPSAALASIAAVREYTHHLLATFHRELDGAYVGHRCMIPHADDADDFLQQLITDELDAVISSAGTATRFAGPKAVEAWLEDRVQNGWKFRSDEKTSCTKDTIVKVLDYQCDDPNKRQDGVVELLRNETGFGEKKSKLLYKEFTSIFYDHEDCQKYLREFARLSNLRRENGRRSRFRTGWVPVLSLGTILRPVFDDEGKGPSPLKKGQLLFCIQPRCDSVRIDAKGRQFPFLLLNEDEKKFQLVVNSDGTDRTYSMQLFFYDAVLFKFAPITRKEAVIKAQKEGDRFVFKDAGGSTFEWIADMKDLPAQREVGLVGARAASVGLDEHEWLRMKR